MRLSVLQLSVTGWPFCPSDAHVDDTNLMYIINELVNKLLNLHTKIYNNLLNMIPVTVSDHAMVSPIWLDNFITDLGS